MTCPRCESVCSPGATRCVACGGALSAAPAAGFSPRRGLGRRIASGLGLLAAAILLVLAIVIPTLQRKPPAMLQANEAVAVADMRTIAMAEEMSLAATGSYTSLECLAQPGACQPELGPSGLIAADLASSGPRAGYLRTFHPGPPAIDEAVAPTTTTPPTAEALPEPPPVERDDEERGKLAPDGPSAGRAGPSGGDLRPEEGAEAWATPQPEQDATAYEDRRSAQPSPTAAPPTKATRYRRYAYVAVPVTRGITGRRAFCVDATGSICYTSDGRAPSVVDGQCDPSSCLPIGR